MIDSFRYSYTGTSSMEPIITFVILTFLCALAFGIALWLFRARKIVE
jgi:ABC-type multidrug transport system permease subunit